MNQPLFVSTDGVTSLADVHGEVAAAVSRLADDAPETPSTEASYGTIASGVTSALGQALPSRDGTLRATSTSGQTIEDLLRTAARRYADGDREGAEKLRAAAETLADSDGGGGAAAAAGTPPITGTAGDQGAQLAGQAGQQAGQLAQGIAQSVQGFVQGFAQIPQQVMQGVQGIVESASKVSGSEGARAEIDRAEADRAEADRAEADGDDDRPDEADEDGADERREPPTDGDGAGPAGRATEAGRAPEPPPPAQPAQTRPQQFPR